MAKKKRTPSFLIDFEPMEVEIERRGKKNKKAEVNKLYFRTDNGVTFIQYAGEISDEAYNCIEMPSDPEFLIKLSKKLKKLAKELA